MLCERIQELMSDYLDGTLSVAFIATVDQHTAECESCRLEMADLRSVWMILDEAPVLEAPPAVRSLAWARIEQQAAESASAPVKSQTKWSWRELFARRPAVGMAALVLLLVLGGVAIPAQFKQARMVFPFNIISSLFHWDESALTIRNPRIDAAGTQRWIIVPAKNEGTKAVTISARVVRPEGPDVAPAFTATLQPGESRDLKLGVLDLSANQSMPVRVMVEGGDGETVTSLSRDITVK